MRYKKATMSILGLYYLEPTIFNLMVLPVDLDKELIIDSILSECAELEILYTDPDLIKKLIGIWSRKHIDNWERLFGTTKLTYNPIWNVDAHITEKEKRIGRDDYVNNENGSNTITDSRTGYNSDAFENTEQENAISGIDRTGNSNSNEDIERTIERGGNIGVTTTQQMIKEEREISEFNIYNLIVDSFKRNFCILVY